MPQTTVGADLLQALEVLTQLAVHAVGQRVAVLAIHDVALTVEEPRRDLELSGVLDDGDKTLELVRVKLASAGLGILA